MVTKKCLNKTKSRYVVKADSLYITYVDITQVSFFPKALCNPPTLDLTGNDSLVEMQTLQAASSLEN